MKMKKNIEFKRFVNKKADPEELKIVKSLSKKFFLYLNEKETVEKLKSFHTLGNSSQKIQDVFISHLKELGFESEKKGLFKNYNSQLRPDYYKKLKKSGIILEVERGKTLKNNMDLLDVWKCHICKEANHLFLVIPKDVSHTPNCFNYSSKRLGLFFLKENYINIDSLTIYGY